MVAVAVLGGVGITRLQEGLPLGDLAPDGHYYKDYDAARVALAKESSIGMQTPVSFCHV